MMQSSANSEVFVPEKGEGLSPEEEALICAAESGASRNIRHARLGRPGVYRLDTEDETLFFEVWSRHFFGENRNVISVFPVSYWIDGERKEYVPPRQKGERQAFLPSCVLYGKFDPERVPEAHREDLSYWAAICLDGIRLFDRQQQRQRRRHRH